MNLKYWLISKLGGVTDEAHSYLINECAKIERRNFELQSKYDAVKEAKESIKHWLQQPLLRVETRGNQFCASAVVALEDRIPVDVLKRDLCKKMADKFFDEGLVAFDVYDGPEKHRDCKILRGEIEVVLPVGFAHRSSEQQQVYHGFDY